MPKDAPAIFAAAAPLYDFFSPDLKPWHMKVSYQLYDEQSKPTAQGTYEYWWAGPKKFRRSWTRAGVEHTSWTIDDQTYRVNTGEKLGYFEGMLAPGLMPPIAEVAKADADKMHLDLTDRKFGKETLPCVNTNYSNTAALNQSEGKTSRSSTFCFDKTHPLLMAYTMLGGAVMIYYEKLMRVQGLVLPKEMSISSSSRKGLTATLDVVDGIAAEVAELSPPAGLAPAKRRIGVGSEVIKGSLVTKVQPVYPQEDKFARIQGTVVISAVIGTDGRIEDTTIITAPSRSLGDAALRAVKQWVYKPYLLNGEPVEVDSTINVVYSLGG